MLNSDVICDFPLKDMLLHHKKENKLVTILTTSVENPSRYGIVVTKNSLVTDFVEKPKVFIGNLINAGIYVFNS